MDSIKVQKDSSSPKTAEPPDNIIQPIVRTPPMPISKKLPSPNIRNLAEEEFQLELQREREERRWVAGRGMDTKWNEALKREQQNIQAYTPDSLYDKRIDASYRKSTRDQEEQQHSAIRRFAHTMPYHRTSEAGTRVFREPSYSRRRNELSSPEGKFYF
jgi:hypothetical protein